jgi:hypothetical protein
MDIIQAKKIFKKNFIGPEELGSISRYLRIAKPSHRDLPRPPLTLPEAGKISKDYLLLWGIPRHRDGRKLTIASLRTIFGSDAARRQPCFYNQDWYLQENFAVDNGLKPQWYLLRKSVSSKSRGQNPENLKPILRPGENFPPAILSVFAFFSYYLLTGGEILWPHDFIWCADKDGNSDRIYVGRYLDPKKKSKNGFNVHRHLSIRPCYGLAPTLNL